VDIRRTCHTCSGAGEIEHGTGTRVCYSCHGAGISDEGKIENGTKTLDERLTDVEDKVDDCLDKLNDIIEKLNEP